MYKFILLFAVILSGCQLKDDSVAICKPSETDTPYCKYKGDIKKIYLNSDGLALIYLNKSFSKEEAQRYGYGIKTGEVIAISLAKESDFSSNLFALASIAFKNNLKVEIHARDTFKGYLKLDRIWVGQ